MKKGERELMNDNMSTKALEILEKSNKAGIRISLDQEGLALKFPKGKKIDNDLLAEIKLNKETLLAYFESFPEGNNQSDLENAVYSIEHDGQFYYEVNSIQDYWIYNETAKENDGTLITSYEITGRINIKSFNKAITYLFQRHESLRSTFHKIDGKNYLRVEKASPTYNPELIDLRSEPTYAELTEQMLRFDGHEFNLEESPLLVFRLIQIEDEKHLLSFKAHHVIFDRISKEVMLKDLFGAYTSFCQNVEPDFAPLTYQLKEYLSFERKFKTENKEAHQKYWNDTFPLLPDELKLNIEENAKKLKEKPCKTESFEIPKAILDKLHQLQKEFSTSLFVVLQATFKTFLHKSTGQNDLVIGTAIYGRDYPSSENQIGSYAKTVLIRTLLNEEDSFSSALLKVRKSNEDMRKYSAFPLMYAMGRMLKEGERLYGKFWKINMQYRDSGNMGFNKSEDEVASEGLNLKVTPIIKNTQGFVQSDLDLSFFNAKENLGLTVYYNAGIYNAKNIRAFISEYIKHMNEVLMIKCSN